MHLEARWVPRAIDAAQLTGDAARARAVAELDALQQLDRCSPELSSAAAAARTALLCGELSRFSQRLAACDALDRAELLAALQRAQLAADVKIDDVHGALLLALLGAEVQLVELFGG